MSELQKRLDQLVLRLDHMSMRVEQAVIDALRAVEESDVQAGLAVDHNDAIIDREEVEIEQECIRLLALYQPAAIDLRTICTIIKINNDLERIADLGASIGRRVKHVVEGGLTLGDSGPFGRLRDDTQAILGRTCRMLGVSEAQTARRIIEADVQIDEDYRQLVRSVLDASGRGSGGAEKAMTVINLAKAMERIGDLCTNIAEDIIFLKTGDIVRHAEAFRDAGR